MRRTSLQCLIILGASAFQAAFPSPGFSGTPDSLAVEESILRADYGQAEATARAWLQRAEAEGDSASVASAAVLLSEALRLTGRARDSEAWDLTRKSLDIRRKLEGPEGAGVAESLRQLGRLHYAWNPNDEARVDTAEALWTEALRMQRAALSPGDPRLTVCLWNLGSVAFQKARYARAESLYSEVLSLREAAYGPDHYLTADVKAALATTLRARSRYREARELLTAAVPVLERELGSGHPWFVEALGALGLLDFNLARYAEADSVLGRALATENGQGQPLNRVSAGWARFRALALINLGRQPEGEDLLIETLNEAGRVQPPLELARVEIRTELALLEQSRGETERARRTMSLVLEGIRGSSLEGGPVHANALYQLGRIEAADGDPGSAASTLARSDSLFSLGPEEGSERHADARLARASLDPSQVGKAEILARETIVNLEKQLGPVHPRVGGTRTRLAGMLLEAGNPVAARREFERAVGVLEQCQEGDAPGLAKTRSRFANCLALLGDYEASWRQAMMAEDAGRSFARRTLMTLADDRTLAGISGRADSRATILSILAAEPTSERVRAGWEAVLRSRGLVFEELCRRRRVMNSPGTLELERHNRDWLDAMGRVTSLEVRVARGEPVEAYLRSSREDADRIERELLRAGGTTGKPVMEVRLEDVRAALPMDHVLCAFVRYQDCIRSRPLYAAFVQGRGAPQFRVLGDADEIDAEINRMVALLDARVVADGDASEEHYRQAAAMVRESVWDPLVQHLDGAKGVLIVADGLTARIPWGALPSPGGGYLVEDDLRFHLLLTERELPTMPSGAAMGEGLLALGDPDFGRAPAGGRVAGELPGLPGDGCQAIFSREWPQLPATAAEVREVSAFWGRHGSGPSRILAGGAATEESLRRNASGKRVLHLATHGFILDTCMPSADARGFGGIVPESGAPTPDTRGSGETLTGLVLAGANVRAPEGRGDDGILTSPEAAVLDLQGVDWAVLSACATALGDIHAGEGVLSLGRAFRIAGARTVIVGLWSLEDTSTRRWMRALYEGRLELGLSTEEAVRAASLQVLQERRSLGRSTHPFYWGGFASLGDWR